MQSIFEAQTLKTFSNTIRERTANNLASLSQKMDLSWLSNKDYQIITTSTQLDWVISCIEAAKIISVDTETTGLNFCNISEDNPIKDKMVGMSISWERNQGIYIPFGHLKFRNMPIKETLLRLKPYLESKPIITHNGLFDGKVFYDLGIKLNITQDTMLLYFNLDSTVSKGSKGLKAITRRLYNYDVIELSDIFEKESDAGLFCYVDEELCKAYACADSDHTFMIFMDTFDMLLPGQRNSYRLDIRVQNELVRSEYYGKGINMPLLRVMNDINNKDLAKLRTLIYSYVGISLASMHNIDTPNNQYIFNIASSRELYDVLFTKLKYPLPEKMLEENTTSVGKYTLKALMDIKCTSQSPIQVADKLVSCNILSDIINHNELHVGPADKNAILVEYKLLSNKAYKLVYLISEYRKLDKLRGTFFTPLLTNNFEGKYFSSIRMTRAETARLIDTIQTLDKYLKALVVPLNENSYMLDYDFAQIEYRTMVGESGMKDLVNILEDPEKDYHREGGSLFLSKRPEDITDEERSSIKSVNFGVAYSMSKYGMLTDRYGIGLTKDEKVAHLAEIEKIMSLWDKGLYPIRDMLNVYREQALKPVADATLPSHLKGKLMGRISNPYGRTRLFDLSKLSKQKEASIKRQAGNFPIQSYSREIFCVAFCDFCDACIAEGLMDILVKDDTKPLGFKFINLVDIMAYIHDECLMSIDSAVNPYFIYKLIRMHCMKHIKGHPTYYCGINIISNWYEGKDDKYEAPVAFVDKQIATNPGKFITPLSATEMRDQVLSELQEYCLTRVEMELATISPISVNYVYDMRQIIPNFTNYFIKPKVFAYLKPYRPFDKTNQVDYVLVSIITLVLYRKYNATFIDLDGNPFILDKNCLLTPIVPNPDITEKEISSFQCYAIEEESFSFSEDSFGSNEDMEPYLVETFSSNTKDLETRYCTKSTKTFRFGG